MRTIAGLILLFLVTTMSVWPNDSPQSQQSWQELFNSLETGKKATGELKLYIENADSGLTSERQALTAERSALESEKQRLLEEKEAYRREKERLNSERSGLQAERLSLESERADLESEKALWRKDKADYEQLKTLYDDERKRTEELKKRLTDSSASMWVAQNDLRAAEERGRKVVRQRNLFLGGNVVLGLLLILALL